MAATDAMMVFRKRDVHKSIHVPWKGTTFNQLVAYLKRNVDTGTGQSQPFRARPSKVYRREIASVGSEQTVQIGTTTGTSAMRCFDFDTPGANIVNSCASSATLSEQQTVAATGVCATLDFRLTTNASERPCTISSDSTVNSAEVNARRRCRSAGMMPRKFLDRGDTGDTVFKPSYTQYLTSRAMTFQQNQFYNLQQGYSYATPGDTLSMSNIYATNSLSACPKTYVSAAKGNNALSYTWINGSTNVTVTFADGYYDWTDLRVALRSAMLSNGHYYTDTTTGQAYYLIDIYYDSYNRQTVLQCKYTDLAVHNSSKYSVPKGQTWTIPTANKGVVPSVSFGTKMGLLLGISGGGTVSYPAITAQEQVLLQTRSYSSDQFAYGTNSQIGPTFRPIYYKPNNPGYAQQGAVPAGDRLARVRYNTITRAAATFKSAYGSQTAAANAYAYSVNNGRNNDKLKSFRDTATPTIDKITGEMQCCEKFIYRH